MAATVASRMSPPARLSTDPPARLTFAQAFNSLGTTVFPYVVATGLALLSIGTFVSAFRHGFPERSKDDYGPIFWIVGGLVAQILLLSTAGFAIATGILFAFTAKGFGRGPLWQTIPIGIVFAFVVWFIFARGLQLSLPMGPFERLVTTGSF